MPRSSAQRGQITMVIERITPEIAKKYLSKNVPPGHGKDPNRYLQPSRVRKLRRELAEGRWLLTHQGIAFDTSGRLIDGQNRLTAIIEAGVPAELCVFRNLDPRARLVIDATSNRTPADRFVMSNGDLAANARDVITMATAMQRGSDKRAKFDADEVVAFARKNEHVIVPLCTTLRPSPVWAGGVAGAFGNAALHFGLDVIKPLAQRFVEERWTGPGDPLKLLQKKLYDLKIEPQGRARHYPYCVTAITAAVEGRQIQRLHGTDNFGGVADTTESGEAAPAVPAAPAAVAAPRRGRPRKAVAAN